MEQKHLLLVDEQPQGNRLQRIAENLHNEGINLIYKEIDPTEYVSRQENGDISFDKESFKNALEELPFLHFLDVFATDYNLIENQLRGIDVLSIFTNIFPHYNKRVIIYSAQIDRVIRDILSREDETFDEQVTMLKLLTNYHVDYLASDGEFGAKLKGLITTEPDLSIDALLSESMMAIKGDDILFAIPPYNGMKMREVAALIMTKDQRSIKLKKEITDHIMACITRFENYE